MEDVCGGLAETAIVEDDFWKITRECTQSPRVLTSHELSVFSTHSPCILRLTSRSRICSYPTQSPSRLYSAVLSIAFSLPRRGHATYSRGSGENVCGGLFTTKITTDSLPYLVHSAWPSDMTPSRAASSKRCRYLKPQLGSPPKGITYTCHFSL